MTNVKNKPQPRKSIITKHITLHGFNVRGQIDRSTNEVIGNENWLLNYEDHATNFQALEEFKS